jgi:hypothetical protein
VALESREASLQEQSAPPGNASAGLKRFRGLANSVPLGKSPKPVEPVVYIPTDGVCPQWASLPYEILRVIFSYACYPLHDESGRPTSSVSWLLSAARLCRAFEAPALHALYECPPITSPLQGHGLLRLLSEARPEGGFNYNTKVRRLDIEVNVLARSAPNLGSFNVVPLLQHCPQLREINIWDRDDDPNGRIYGNESSHWYYYDGLFSGFTESGLRLRAWHWNAKFMRPFTVRETESGIECLGDMLLRRHSTFPVFSQLRKLRLTHFTAHEFQFAHRNGQPDYFHPQWTQYLEKITLPEADSLFKTPCNHGKSFAQALSCLEGLEQLEFVACGITTLWLQILSNPLKCLKLRDCPNIDARGFQLYLHRHGAELRELVLDHNLALSLSFVTTLKSSCPKLEILKMDLTYRSSLVASDARDPEYVDLLEADEKPAWPSTLRSIELLHLRNWTRSAAELFLSSLIEAAPELPELRCLILSASISISWRERAAFRDSWISRFQRVFQRQAKSPRGHLASMKSYRMWKEQRLNNEALFANGNRRFSHIQISPRKHPIEIPSDSDDDEDDQPLPKRRRRQAVSTEGSDTTRQLRPRRSKKEQEEGEENAGSSLRDMVMEAPETHIQGMCDVVDIRIDNLRPRENQLTEGDFLDEEQSGDEDWEEGVDDVEGGGDYAW